MKDIPTTWISADVKKYAYHPDPKGDQCIGVDSPHLCFVLRREVLDQFPIPNRPMPGMFLHLDLRHLPPGGKNYPFCKNGNFERDPNFWAVS
jgi:hypothetical protein